MKTTTLNIGHRGAKGHITENTIASIKKAIEMGADGIELDVHNCASGELVVFHDFTIDRLSNESGEISKFSLTELKKIELKGNHQIPTLEDVLEVLPKNCLLNIELKGTATATETSRIVKYYVENKGWEYDNFIVSSFQWNLIQAVYEINKEIPLGVLTEIPIHEALKFAKTVNAKAIHPDYTLLTNENVQQMKREGYKVYTWTVNQEDAIKRIQSYNVDGIITDYLDRL